MFVRSFVSCVLAGLVSKFRGNLRSCFTKGGFKRGTGGLPTKEKELARNNGAKRPFRV